MERIVGSKSIEFVETQHTKYRDAARGTRWKECLYWIRGRIPKIYFWRRKQDTSRSKELWRKGNSIYNARYNRWSVFLQRLWYSSNSSTVCSWIQTTQSKLEYLSKNGNKHLSILHTLQNTTKHDKLLQTTTKTTTNYSKTRQTTPKHDKHNKHDKLLQNNNKLLQNTTNYSKTTTNYSKTPQTTPKHHKLLQNNNKLLQNTTNYSKTPQTTPKYNKLPPNTTNYPQIRQTTPKQQTTTFRGFCAKMSPKLHYSTIPQDVVAASLRTKEVVQSTNGNIVGKDTMQNAMEQRVSRASTNVSQRYT